MKTTKIYLVVCLTFLLTQFNALGQYNGGNSNGASKDELSLTSCSIPPHFYAYFGGVNDGSSVFELSNTACGTAAFQFAYMGGTADGAATEEASITACGIPPSFFAYFGGNNDGANVETFEQSVCGFPPQFYAYFGGDGDGFTIDKTAPICPTQPPVASFTASSTSICVGQSVTFTDTSTNIPSAWTWTFTGGTPNSSIVQNPVITYNTPGSYAVTLVAANYNGTDTITQTGYITVTAYPTVQTTTPASRCDTGTVTLGATASAGTLSWYANSIGGAALGTGTSFTTPSISITTTYYVETVNATCSSSRTAVIATVNTTPSITATTPNSRCGSGSVTLNATSSAGNTIWYANPTGGIALATTNSFATPSISTTTTYYVEATSGSCTSPRTPVTATVNTLPTVLTTTPASRCDAGAVTLGATASSGTLDWYANSSGGTSLGTGTSYLTPSISTSTTYYVEASTASCTSVRTAVTATVNTTPTVTPIPNGRCDAGSVTISASANAGTISWYANASGGSALGTGTSFSTPNILTTTTYYAESVNGTCISSRVPVVATVNTSPSITTTTPASACTPGCATLASTASSGTIQWFTVASGGAVYFTGANLTICNLPSTSTYYVQTTNGTCTSNRVPVVYTVTGAIPSILSTTGGNRCGPGTVTLNAVADSGTLNWYNAATGGTLLGTGNSFTTPSISATTIYYVEASNGTCSSNRLAVTASISSTSPPIANANQTFCNGETVGLITVIPSGPSIIWYTAASGGSVVPNGTALVSGTTYYASQTISGCESTSRTAVTMTLGGCLGNDEFEINNLKVYPNPTIDILTVSYSEPISGVEVFNIIGQQVFSVESRTNEVQIDMARYASGTYLIKVSVDDMTKTVKVIKK
ncbi:T9SS type A sorting domain-containing protein [Flavobacterium paronense]|uniref:T9SS type A sorting domain-containing protein n=1 Tax=Flavobacterium paronense TaxID=1392775 RepID=A0ABV5GDM5_9FLAO|nr:T9SS type A sorting domain-containing protein [Flavobacterium paronense]MDN3678006.1 T9SS type A sorting domain-containing protein [Flavobacterium paronense]